VSALSRHHNVTLITTHGPGDDPEGLARQLPDCHQVISIPYDVPKRGSSNFPLAVARQVDDLAGRSVEVAVGDMRGQVQQLIGRNRIDVCVRFLFAAANVPFGGSVPVVLFEHNVEYLIWKRLSALERNPIRKALFEIEWRKLRFKEAEIRGAADLTIAVSEEDRRRRPKSLRRGDRRNRDRGRYGLLRAGGTSGNSGPAGLQRVDGLAPERGRGDYFGEHILRRSARACRTRRLPSWDATHGASARGRGAAGHDRDRHGR
jgi:hypothetical protein